MNVEIVMTAKAEANAKINTKERERVSVKIVMTVKAEAKTEASIIGR